MKNLTERLSQVADLFEEVKPGQYFVLVDVSVAGGKMNGPAIELLKARGMM